MLFADLVDGGGRRKRLVKARLEGSPILRVLRWAREDSRASLKKQERGPRTVNIRELGSVGMLFGEGQRRLRN
jgi:hypothetical protein